MKEEEIIKQLENVQIPDIELPAHRQWLKSALLDSAYLKKQREMGIVGVLRSQVQSGINMIMNGLLTRRPVWKVALGSTLAVALIAALVLVLPSPDGQSNIARAIEIAKNDPQVLAALGVDEDDEVEVKVIATGPNSITVQIEEGKTGVMVVVEVDSNTGTVSEIIKQPLLTDEDKEKAIEIAKTDPIIREILDEGYVIHTVLPFFQLAFNQETGDLEEASGTWVKIIMSRGEMRDRSWMAIVDIVSGKVELLIEGN